MHFPGKIWNLFPWLQIQGCWNETIVTRNFNQFKKIDNWNIHWYSQASCEHFTEIFLAKRNNICVRCCYFNPSTNNSCYIRNFTFIFKTVYLMSQLDSIYFFKVSLPRVSPLYAGGACGCWSNVNFNSISNSSIRITNPQMAQVNSIWFIKIFNWRKIQLWKNVIRKIYSFNDVMLPIAK